MISSAIGAFRTVPKSLEKRLDDLEIRGRIEIIQNYGIVEISQNTKNREDLKRLAVPQPLVKDY